MYTVKLVHLVHGAIVTYGWYAVHRGLIDRPTQGPVCVQRIKVYRDRTRDVGAIVIRNIDRAVRRYGKAIRRFVIGACCHLERQQVASSLVDGRDLRRAIADDNIAVRGDDRVLSYGNSSVMNHDRSSRRAWSQQVSLV